MRRYTSIPSPFGSVGIVVTPQGLAHIRLTAQSTTQTNKRLREDLPDADYDPHLLPALQRRLRDYFRGRRVGFRVKLDLSSLTPFHRRVLQECAGIAHGHTLTYGQLARRIGRPRAARAVGQALARNPVPLVIPCHRVVGGDGGMGGFSAENGVTLKRWLLELESGR